METQGLYITALVRASTGSDNNMVTRQELVEYLSKVLEEGENLLVCQQTPILDSTGELQYHADGAIKCTWPPQKPGARAKSWKSTTPAPWYINTGIFKGPRATYELCVALNFILCDDVGTKSQPFDLVPTWEIETSPGNFQRGYVLAQPLEPAEGAATVRALARCGFTDPGAGTAVRWARLPGSLNLKPSKRGFLATVTAWNPDAIYTGTQILAAAGVTVTDDDYIRASVVTPVGLRGDENDPVLAWLAERQMVLSTAGPEGWYQVVCPNAAEHTDGDPKAKYLPATHGYRCFHGHCDHLDARAFLTWVAEQGGPKVEPGVRDDLLVDPMANAMAIMEQIRAQVARPLFREDADAPQVAAAVEREEQQRQLHNVERDGWGQRYAYVIDDDSYFDLVTRARVSRAAFDALYRHVPCRSRHTGRLLGASKWFDEHRAELGASALDNFIYAAGGATLYSSEGLTYGNLWHDRRPDVSGADPQHRAVGEWLQLAERLIPTTEEREHLLNWMAYKVQHPEDKINHQVLFSSPPGYGKDTLIYPWLYAIGGATQQNVSTVSIDKISSQFSYHLPNEVIVINESEETAYKEARQLENKLKEYCAAPPVILEANLKHRHPFKVMNRFSVLAMSNKDAGITLPDDDRRWFVIWGRGHKMPDSEGRWRWRSYNDGGTQAIALWLRQRDVSAFNPGATAPWTEAKEGLISHSMSDVEEVIQSMAIQLTGPFRHGVVGSPYAKLLDIVGLELPNHGKGLTRTALMYALKRARWVYHPTCQLQVERRALPKRNIWTAPGMFDGASKADIYAALLKAEQAAIQGPALAVVK